MASLTTRKNGSRFIQFINAHEKSVTITLGKLDRKAAQAIKVRVEELVSSRDYGSTLSAATQRWLREIPDRLHEKLVNVGLTEQRDKRSMREVVASYIAQKETAGRKASTIRRMRTMEKRMHKYFECDIRLDKLSEADVLQWRDKLQDAGYSANTIAKDASQLSTIMAEAIRRGLATMNPFQAVGRTVGAAKKRYINLDEAYSVLDACPDIRYKALVGLCRFGGLRKSEATSLTWDAVDFDSGDIRVEATKTDTERLVLMREPLYGILQEAKREAEAVGSYDPASRICHFSEGKAHVELNKIIESAGLTKWSSPFNSMRASCGINLALSGISIMKVAYQLGHTVEIASRHYLDVAARERRAINTDDPFAFEAQCEAQDTLSEDSEPERTNQPNETANPLKNTGHSLIEEEMNEPEQTPKMARAGLEPARPLRDKGF